MAPSKSQYRATGEIYEHGIGRLGEQTLADWLGSNGYVVMYGPSGSVRAPRGSPYRVHQPTTKGLDMIAFRPRDGNILILDNKAGEGGMISDVGAFTTRVRAKLRNRIDKIKTASPGLPPEMAGHVDQVIRDLEQAERALAKKGDPWPVNVVFGISNAAGESTSVNPKLVNQLKGVGIKQVEFLDFHDPMVKRTTLAGPRAGTRVRGRVVKIASVLKLGLTAFGVLQTGTALAATATGDPLLQTISELTPRTIMKEQMLKSLEKLPKPVPDRRGAMDYLTDPDTASGMRTIDLFNKNLPLLGRELDQHHRQAMVETALEIMMLGLTARSRPSEDQIEDLHDLYDELGDYYNDLFVILDSLEAAQQLAPKARDAAQGAEQMRKVLGNLWVQDKLLFEGFDYEEIQEMYRGVEGFAAKVDKTFQDVDAVHAQVQKELDELASLSWDIGKLSWSLLLEPLIEKRPPPAPDGPDKDERDVLAVIPGLPGASVEDIKRRLRQLPGRDFIPSVEKVLDRLEKSNKVNVIIGPGVRHGKVYWI
jgi:hypothetical protein